MAKIVRAAIPKEERRRKAEVSALNGIQKLLKTLHGPDPKIAALLGELRAVLLEKVDPQAALVVLNSLCFDYALRLRTAGTNVSFTYIKPMPVPPPAW